MRRERRGFNRNNMDIKRILYTAGGVLSISIITFIAMFLLNSGNTQDKTRIAEFNTQIMSENNNSSVEETSSQMGKTVNEMENEETNSVANEISEENNKENEEEKKYAVNTSNVQGEKEAKDVHYEVGKKVRKAIADIGGMMPEEMSTPKKSLKELEREKKQLESKEKMKLEKTK